MARAKNEIEADVEKCQRQIIQIEQEVADLEEQIEQKNSAKGEYQKQLQGLEQELASAE
jgi:cell division protein FtsL